MRFSCRTLSALALFASLTSGVSQAKGDIIDESTAPKKVYFGQAPAQVRRDLLSIFAECGTSPEIVRSTAIVEQGPYGGPGRRDFKFAFTKADWPRKWNSVEYPSHGRCTGNYEWLVLWMSLPNGNYKELVLVGDSLIAKRERYLIFDVGCGEGPWWSSGHFASWNTTRQAFVPVTKCMKKGSAAAWITAHGYDNR